MNISSVQDFLHPGTTSSDRSIVVAADKEFNLTLKLGQVIKGKVLRHYEGSRYGVSFDGKERVVDSASPLRTGELIQGRVIGLDDKVHLQRIADSSLRDESPVTKPRVSIDHREAIAALFARYRVPLTPAQHSALVKLRARLGGSALLAPSALIVHKLGLPQEPVLVQAIHYVLEQAKLNTGPLSTELGPQLLKALESGVVDASIVQGLAPMLARLAEQVVSGDSEQLASESQAETIAPQTSPESALDHHNTNDDRQQQSWQLGQWLLNAHSDGSVAHRYLRFPLWLNDRMVEVSLALFSQHDKHSAKHTDDVPLKYKKAVFSLATENLGQVEIQALVADRHLRLTVNTDRQSTAEFLGDYLSTLSAALTEHGWHVDEIRYQARDELSGVVQSLIEHHATPDSLSQLM